MWVNATKQARDDANKTLDVYLGKLDEQEQVMTDGVDEEAGQRAVMGMVKGLGGGDLLEKCARVIEKDMSKIDMVTIFNDYKKKKDEAAAEKVATTLIGKMEKSATVKVFDLCIKELKELRRKAEEEGEGEPWVQARGFGDGGNRQASQSGTGQQCRRRGRSRDGPRRGRGPVFHLTWLLTMEFLHTECLHLFVVPI